MDTKTDRILDSRGQWLEQFQSLSLPNSYFLGPGTLDPDSNANI
jgi:hypothetical protein